MSCSVQLPDGRLVAWTSPLGKAMGIAATAPGVALTVSEPGHLTNGPFTLPEALRVEITPARWTGPVANAVSTITFRQHVGATDALRTGAYTRTLTFMLSTTNP